MAVNHSHASPESRAFCDELLSELQKLAPSAFRRETSNCGFAIEGSNRFAYVYHARRSSLGTIYLRGDDPNLISPLSNGAVVELRKTLSGLWAREFPLLIHIPTSTPPNEVAEILVSYSLPLAAPKRGAKKSPNRVNDIELRDGKIRTVLSTRYERSQILRTRCLQHHGYRCAACKVLMSERYGKIAEKLIHLHHLERLADTGERKIDPEKDLIPLCPNCHSVAHLENPPLTIGALRRLLFENQSNAVPE